MSYSAKILADSVSRAGHRLTTLEVTFPRIVLAEFNTHRMLSRNSASSRAIPVAKQLRRVLADPFVPDRFGINKSGMQADRWLEGAKLEEARRIWLRGLARSATSVFEALLGERLSAQIFGYDPEIGFAPYETLLEYMGEAFDRLDATDANDSQILNIHKQDANRLLEPWMWHTVIVTATEWDNFFALRNHADAQRQIMLAARLMQEAMAASEPRFLDESQWHLPLVNVEPGGWDHAEWQARGQHDWEFWAKVSAARCARVSYLTHDKNGELAQRDTAKDLALYERLAGSGHMSPLEHVARPMTRGDAYGSEWSGNFHGWVQFRKTVPNEDNFAKALKDA